MNSIQKVGGFGVKFSFGNIGEGIVGGWLQQQQVVHFALHSFGIAPRSPRVREMNGATLLCPDFICWKEQEQYFVEVKRFSRWWKRPGEIEQVGVEEWKFEEYKRLAEVTGKKLFIYFLNFDKGKHGDGLFSAETSSLRPAGNTFPPDSRPLLMFNRSDLTHLANDSDLAWQVPTNGTEPDDDPADGAIAGDDS
jgi:hypothetical protein